MQSRHDAPQNLPRLALDALMEAQEGLVDGRLGIGRLGIGAIRGRVGRRRHVEALERQSLAGGLAIGLGFDIEAALGPAELAPSRAQLGAGGLTNAVGERWRGGAAGRRES